MRATLFEEETYPIRNVWVQFTQPVDLRRGGRCATIRIPQLNGARVMSDFWLGSLITDTPQAGFELAIKLSRMGVKYTQPSAEVRDRLRPQYGEDATALIASSQVVATNFQTIAAANNYWRQ